MSAVDMEMGPETTTITMTLPTEVAEYIGGYDGWTYLDKLHTTLWALATARKDADSETPIISKSTAENVLRDIQRVTDRMEALRDYWLLALHRAGGSHGDAAYEMECPKSTAVGRKRSAELNPSRYAGWVAGEHQVYDRPASGTTPGGPLWRRVIANDLDPEANLTMRRMAVEQVLRLAVDRGVTAATIISDLLGLAADDLADDIQDLIEEMTTGPWSIAEPTEEKQDR